MTSQGSPVGREDAPSYSVGEPVASATLPPRYTMAFVGYLPYTVQGRMTLAGWIYRRVYHAGWRSWWPGLWRATRWQPEVR